MLIPIAKARGIRSGKLMTNTYGITMKGLRDAAKATKRLTGASGARVQLNYDNAEGIVFVNRVQHDTWVRYRNETVLVVCQVCEPLTAQQVADLVARRLV